MLAGSIAKPERLLHLQIKKLVRVRLPAVQAPSQKDPALFQQADEFLYAPARFSIANPFNEPAGFNPPGSSAFESALVTVRAVYCVEVQAVSQIARKAGRFPRGIG